MAKKTESLERELALLREARKEAEALKAAGAARPASAMPAAARPAAGPAARAASPAAGTPPDRSAVPVRRQPVAQPGRPGLTTPLDQPTVDGWAHPAARDAEPKVKIAAEEKWSRLAAVMEIEQREAREQRAKLRRTARYALIGITVFIILAVMFSLRR